ncbi:SDR family NAD(P)-dependent oxidoreductase [Glycomyces algeriensis]|uniref:Dehydrogenase n=1 Tax=Glycomyces algeriensis TaxID=256037 RepID=A0A9W6GBW0_9ACTN|nr:glucose 1-dehydrogenase [Glycomyces algeriensis]MDA1365584.1 glucose 1-dehydrogenase [Glycomyces algeriensis]MDR7351272.1 3alpha(or 20beta)-hydroxysteroid dehydrogenase [Glycomyces algeriensis]GLI43987.1 dehydrogenase [Glycomyces algeriensis]
MSGLEGRVAIVTGGARGIGATYVRALHAEGAHVVITDILADQGEALAEELGADAAPGAGRASFCELDVTDEEAWDRAVAETLERFGAVDVLVNNAGMANAAPIEHFTLAKWNTVLAVNLTGTFLGCRAVVPAMKAAGRGSIVNVSSVEGLRGSERLHGYTATKFGVRGLTKSLAVELGRDGIRVNSIHPGFIETEMTTRIDPARLLIPLGRPGAPADLAGALVFLAGDASAYVTGAEIVVDGGMTTGIPHT